MPSCENVYPFYNLSRCLQMEICLRISMHGGEEGKQHMLYLSNIGWIKEIPTIFNST